MKSCQHLLLLLTFILIAILVSIIAHDFKAIVFRGTQLDSIGHLIGFFILIWFLHGVLKFPLLNVFICLVLYAALTELGQLYLGFRNGEISDFIADLVGMSFFVMIKWLKSICLNKLKL
jgi:VanZ family protein